MKTEQFTILMYKEWRRHRTILIASAVLTGLPYVILLLSGNGSLGDTLQVGSGFSLVLSCLLAGFFSGNAVAGERQTRSIEFLAYLPIDRRLDLLSRMAVAAGLTIALFAVHLLLMFPTLGWPHAEQNDPMFFMFTTALGIFGLSWFASMVWRTPVIPAVMGLGVIVMLLIFGVRYSSDARQTSATLSASDFYWRIFYPVASLSLGLGGFAIGSLWHLKRKVLR